MDPFPDLECKSTLMAYITNGEYSPSMKGGLDAAPGCSIKAPTDGEAALPMNETSENTKEKNEYPLDCVSCAPVPVHWLTEVVEVSDPDVEYDSTSAGSTVTTDLLCEEAHGVAVEVKKVGTKMATTIGDYKMIVCVTVCDTGTLGEDDSVPIG